MSKAIIGNTGFIGSNLCNQTYFDDFYNSKNIAEIKNKKYDFVISAGNPSLRWKINQNGEEDLSNIKKFIEYINEVNVDTFVLVSTIDVYKTPVGVYEDSEADVEITNPYGRNRLYLEEFIKNKFENHLIIRLPIVYGANFRKNIIFDLLNNHEVEKIDTTAKLQFYNVKNLYTDISSAIESKIKLLNMATAPILVRDILDEVFDINFENPIGKGLVYDMRTRYGKLFRHKLEDYIYSREEIIEDLKNFKKQYKNES
ncbi:MAG: NAD-dependent epimerase/dehydratase family protein [Patescibacteria group bacterium]